MNLQALRAGILGWMAVVVAMPAVAMADTAADAAPACGVAAQETYFPCSSCHGVRGEGNEAFAAPALAAQQEAYLERQLIQFQTGRRGHHPADVRGQQMTLLARSLRGKDDIRSVACFAASLPLPPAPTPTIRGNVRRGSRLYSANCAACHGARGEGDASLNAPALTPLADWYLLAQLDGYRLGFRGADPADGPGQQMRAAAVALSREQDRRDVVAFIARRR